MRMATHLAIVPFAFALLVVGAPAAQAHTENAGAWIARMNRALLGGTTFQADATLESRDHTGSGETMEFELTRRVARDGVRTLLEVEAPSAARGIAYEFIDRVGSPPERWTYIPTVRRVRKLVGLERTDAFMGSEFTYEDLEIVTPDERGVGVADRTRLGDEDRIRITSEGYGGYGQVVTWLDPATALPVRVEYFDPAGALWKRADYEFVSGREHPLPNRIRMQDLQTGGESVLSFHDVTWDANVPLTRFSDTEISRRRQSEPAGQRK